MAHDDERYFGYVVTDTARLLRTVFDRRVRGLGLTRAQCVVLARLKRRPGLSQSEIADLLEVEKATAGRLIDRLEDGGWVERRPDPKDRRVNRLHLTSHAEALHATFWPIAEMTVADALRDLSDDEQRLLTDLLLRVKGSLQAMAERGAAEGARAAEVPDDGELVGPNGTDRVRAVLAEPADRDEARAL